jgi:hypothetical protein
MEMNRSNSCILFAFFFLAFFLIGCGKKSEFKSASQDNNTAANVPVKKLTGSKEDLCRIVMVQNRHTENSGHEKEKNKFRFVYTILTDGTGGTIVADIDSIIKKIKTDADKRIKPSGKQPIGLGDPVYDLVLEYYLKMLKNTGKTVDKNDSSTFESFSPEKKGDLYDSLMMEIGRKRKKDLNPRDSFVYALLMRGPGKDEESSAEQFRKKIEDHVISDIKVPRVTKDLKNLIFSISYDNDYYGGIHRRLSDNLVIANLEQKRIEYVVKDSEEEFDPKEKMSDGSPDYPIQWIRHWGLLGNSSILFFNRIYSFYKIDYALNVRKSCSPNVKVAGVMPVSPNECYVNYFDPPQSEPHSSKFHLGKLNVETGKLTPLPAIFDSLALDAYSVSEDCNTILLYRSTEPRIPWHRRDEVEVTKAEDTIQFDTVLVFDRDFKKKKSFILANSAADFELDPTGKWVYFGDRCTIFRYRLDKIADNERTSFEELQKKSETVWIAPQKNEICFSYESFYITSITDKVDTKR